MKRIAVLSSGRDVSGTNAAIRAIVTLCKQSDIVAFGVSDGFRGLYEDHIAQIQTRDVLGKIGKASSLIGTSHSFRYIEPDHVQRIMANLNARSIEGLIIIGGGGSFALSERLSKRGVPIVGIPATIQDDIVGTDICLGVDSAVNNIMGSIDAIRSCDSSRGKAFLVEVEGRVSGSLALRSSLVSGAEYCLVPEFPNDDLDEVTKKITEHLDNGKTQCISVVANGWKPGSKALFDHMQQTYMGGSHYAVRRTVLGYVQRGGSPSGFDRLLGTKFGAEAFNMLMEGNTNSFVGIQNNELVRVPFSEMRDKFRSVKMDQLQQLNLKI